MESVWRWHRAVAATGPTGLQSGTNEMLVICFPMIIVTQKKRWRSNGTMWKCPQTGCQLVVLHPIRLTRGVWWCSVCEQLVRDLVLITSCWTGCLHRPGRLSSRSTVAVLTNRRQRRTWLTWWCRFHGGTWTGFMSAGDFTFKPAFLCFTQTCTSCDWVTSNQYRSIQDFLLQQTKMNFVIGN